jgi:hypothetical protein
MAKVEQSIGGIQVGKTLSEARRAYPNLARSKGGVWSVPIGRNCKLEVVAAHERTDVGAPIEVVTLERVDSSNLDKDEVCDAVATSAGLRFGAGLQDIQRLYRGISLMEPGKDPSLYRGDNGPECLTGRSPILRSMFIYWSRQSHRIAMISVEGSTLACREYKDTTDKQ